MSSNPGVTSSNLRVASSGPRLTNSNPWVANSNKQFTSSNPRVTNSKLWVRRIKARVSKLNTQADRWKVQDEKKLKVKKNSGWKQ